MLADICHDGHITVSIATVEHMRDLINEEETTAHQVGKRALSSQRELDRLQSAIASSHCHNKQLGRAAMASNGYAMGMAAPAARPWQGTRQRHNKQRLETQSRPRPRATSW